MSGAARERGVGVHVHDVLDLLAPVADAELALLELLRHLLLFVGVLRGEVVHVLDEALHVAEAEEFGDEGLGGEAVEVVQVLADTEEDDGSLGRGDAGEVG